MKYIINRVELFDDSDKKTIIKNLNKPTNDIDISREEFRVKHTPNTLEYDYYDTRVKYGCKRVCFMYTQVVK